MSTNGTIQLNYSPREWQEQCHKQRKRFTVLALHRRAGKTELAIMELLDKAMRCTAELGLFIYLAPFLKQAKAIAWARLKQKVEPLRLGNLIEISEVELAVRFPHNGATVRIFGADNPDAMRGVRLDGVVIDEVAWIKPEVWHDIIQPALSDRQGWAMFIGTPHGTNLFSELFHQAGSTAGWWAARWTVYETNALDPTEVERLRQGMPDASFAREYLCDFSVAGDDQLISLADVEEAARRAIGMQDLANAPRIVGVDPARFGDDRSVIAQRQGLQMLDPIVLRGIDNMTLAARVSSVIEDWQPDAVFIDSGAGAGVIDRLRQLGQVVIEVPFGGRAMRPNLFVNRRAEMWFELRDWILAGGAIPNIMTLKQELSTPTYWFDSAGRKALESKDEIKKRLQGGSSPDIADALALTFASPVGKRMTAEEEAVHAMRRQQHAEYDPIATMIAADRVGDYDPYRSRR